ncbi:hypothetical protein DSO57_1009570 [Entomophthora muscae]|uniref:Uncharacterized protein n=1 Tax=Entomophthora muscae TaxID=34485 RepID=A0ACC2RXZ6_9FUNG|nr:hypothetical protein DSO57_1009570 [Entomophthora muscae]
MESKKIPQTDCRPDGDCIPCVKDSEGAKDICNDGAEYYQLLKCPALFDETGNVTKPGSETYVRCTDNSYQKIYFSRFLIFNLVIAVLASFLVIWRKRKIKMDQHRNMLRQLESS